MEPKPIIPLPPVPKPGPEYIQPAVFHKSRVILVLSYILLVLFLAQFFMGTRIFMGRSVFSIVRSIVFLIPAALVVFTKKESVYRVARVFVIIQVLLPVIFLIVMILIFGGIPFGFLFS